MKTVIILEPEELEKIKTEALESGKDIGHQSVWDIFRSLKASPNLEIAFGPKFPEDLRPIVFQVIDELRKLK